MSTTTDALDRFERSDRRRRRIIIVAAVLVVVIGLAFALRFALGVASYTVTTSDMEDALTPGDNVIVTPVNGDPDRGDILAFVFSGPQGALSMEVGSAWFGRCIARAGDTIAVRDMTAIVNGATESQEPTLRLDGGNRDTGLDRARTYPSGAGFTGDRWGPMRVPAEGDAIELNDSTLALYEAIILDAGHEVTSDGTAIRIDGTPVRTYVIEQDYCFVLGDNRATAEDSRYRGFVPYDRIRGRVTSVEGPVP